MGNSSMIPKAWHITDAKRERQDAERLAEVMANARNASATTVGSKGRLDVVGGDFSVTKGGNASVEDGGQFRINGGGSMVVGDDGEIQVLGVGHDWLTGNPVEVRSCLANRLADNSWIGYKYLQPGLYFNSGDTQGATDPRVVSEDGVGLNLVSAIEPLRYGPQVGPSMVASSNVRISPDAASIGSGTWDDAVNPGGGNGLAGRKGSSYGYFTPSLMLVQLVNEGSGTPSIPSGVAAGISASLEEGVLQLEGRNGVNVQGTFTVNGAPVSGGGGSVSSVAGRTGAVTLTKDDVTGLQDDLDAKASNTLATVNANGLMSAADKTALNALKETAWVKLPLASGWSDYTGGGGYRAGLWYQLAGGSVLINGMVVGGSGRIATLPTAACPLYTSEETAVSAGTGGGVRLKGSTADIPGAIDYRYGPASPGYVSVNLRLPLK